MTLQREQLVQNIHAAPTQVVLAMSGGGSGALASLLEMPGASRTVLEAVVPYSEAAMISWLGGKPDHFCSQRTARAMAMAAFHRARLLEPTAGQIAGVACTASLATDRPKLGPHRIHVAAQTIAMTGFATVELIKGARSRMEEEAVTDAILLNTLSEACGLEERLDAGLREGERLESARAAAPTAWQDLLLGKTEAVRWGRDGGRGGARALFPGEFNPLHVGHQQMARAAEQLLGVPVEYEIAITNVEKPPLDYFEVQRRTSQFDAQQHAVWLTRAPRFLDKARLFPSTTFLVGIDTIRRIAAPRYYGNDPVACLAALEAIAARGCRFLVFGRNLGTGFMTLKDLDLPPRLQALCVEVPAEQFREDVSSTELRRAGKW